MKTLKFTLIGLALLSSNYVFCQGQNASTEPVSYIINQPAQFYELDNNFVPQLDTVFLTNKGFIIENNIREITFGGIIYCVFSYPNFTVGSNQQSGPTVVLAAASTPSYTDLNRRNGKRLAMPKTDFDQLRKISKYPVGFRKNAGSWVAGQLTLPFKLRPTLDTTKFKMTTDVSLGAYGGYRIRAHKTEDFYFTLVGVAGLAFINVDNNVTSNTRPDGDGSRLHPGFTLAGGILMQLNTVSFGVVTGSDFVSDIGDDWLYNGKMWFSFAIGFAFLR